MTHPDRRSRVSLEDEGIGGEFFPDPAWNLPQPAPQEGIFLAGGSACLRVIARFLLQQGVRRIWLPDYLCVAVPRVLRAQGLALRFYPVRRDLTPEPAALAAPRRQEALLWVNYFGLPPSPALADALRSLRAGGIWTVEDNAQGGQPHPDLADFSFNSLRKFCAYDGAYLHSHADHGSILSAQEPPANARLETIRAYRLGLRRYRVEGIGNWRGLNRLYRHAERLYQQSETIRGDEIEKDGIERLDWERIRRRRLANFLTLQELLPASTLLEPVLPPLTPDDSGNAMPLGYPLFLTQHSPQWVLDQLASQGIGGQLHWQPLAAPSARQLARKMLTLPVDPRASRRGMLRVAGALRRILSQPEAPAG